jgi:hypothetical protein
MKKFLSAVLVCVLLVGTMFTLVSCGNSLSGTYEGLLFDLKFKGSKVTIIVDDEEVLTGTYEIKEEDDKKTISFDFVDEDDATEDEKKVLKIIDAILGADLPFEENGKTIEIGKILKSKFTKK